MFGLNNKPTKSLYYRRNRWNCSCYLKRQHFRCIIQLEFHSAGIAKKEIIYTKSPALWLLDVHQAVCINDMKATAVYLRAEVATFVFEQCSACSGEFWKGICFGSPFSRTSAWIIHLCLSSDTWGGQYKLCLASLFTDTVGLNSFHLKYWKRILWRFFLAVNWQ